MENQKGEIVFGQKAIDAFNPDTTVNGKRVMKSRNFVIDDFINEVLQDPQANAVEHNPGKHFIAVDYNSLEERVLIHYIINSRGTATLSKILVGLEEISLDMLYGSEKLGLPDKDIQRIYNVYGSSKKDPYRIRSNERNRVGDYRYDYGRNHHPRSPRKR
ncbi:hypothetical protein PP749_gp032 [Rhizobium phage RHEph22]|uniref:Uncharacterized protein n=1 Tax=Rhizobium phage RHEph22 TaxID=2836135 RepID=A0AAE8AVX3_9CAUD|nr:hypothetical protein PP749_gp032 [Rhizobium phage RHEph22]QXV74705.1 hypothetical protein [Rhizobium phage RHEph22]